MHSKNGIAASAILIGLAGLPSPADAQWTRNSASSMTYLANAADRVGIGIASPTAKLDVRGGQAVFGPASGQPGVVTIRPSVDGAWWNLANTHNGSKLVIAQGDKRAANDNTGWTGAALVIQLNGNVGIGTLNPQSTLAVNGAVTAKSLVITSTGWADHVFAPEYDLRPLSAVEAHIRKEKRLPGIPGAAEVAGRGVDVGEMQVKLLEKIEELTLYVIDQEARIAKLAARNEALERRVDARRPAPPAGPRAANGK